MVDTTTLEELVVTITAARAQHNANMPMPQPSDLRVLALALKAYATWLERDPDTYDADALAQTLEKVGVIESNEWRPTPWVLDAVKALRG